MSSACTVAVEAAQAVYTWRGEEDSTKFDLFEETHADVKSTGELPPALRDSASASLGRHIYFYGGKDGSNRWLNSLCQVEAGKDGLVWSLLAEDGPRIEGRCGMLACRDKLVVFGGVVDLESAKEVEGKTSDVAMHQLHIFYLHDKQWSSLQLIDSKKSLDLPCTDFSLTMVAENFAVLFGGLNHHKAVTHDAYVLDLASLKWDKLLFSAEDKMPAGRSSHAAVCLQYGDQPQLLISGGIGEQDEFLEDAWVLDVATKSWTQVMDYVDTHRARAGHTAAVFHLDTKVAEVSLFGGIESSSSTSTESPAVLRLEFTQDKKTWKQVDFAEGDQLGSNERLKYKMKKLRKEYLRQSEEAKKAVTRTVDHHKRASKEKSLYDLPFNFKLVDFLCC